MKFCTKCGKELIDEAIVCTGCGCSVVHDKTVENVVIKKAVVTRKESNLMSAAKILMILGTVWTAIFTFSLGLAWCLPMTIIFYNKLEKGEPVSVVFKVCSLIFVNIIAGILMLCDTEEQAA